MKLTICLGTRGRPALLVPTLEKTVAMLAQPDTAFVVAIDHDDQETIAAIPSFPKDVRIIPHVAEREDNFGSKWNRALRFPADVYFCMVDYRFMVTPAFDKIILDAAARFPDNIGVIGTFMANASFPEHQAVTHGLAKKLGFVYPPYFPYWFVDHWIDDIARMIDRYSFAAIRSDGNARPGTQNMRELTYWADYFERMLLLRRRSAEGIIRSEDFLETPWRKEMLLAGFHMTEFRSLWANSLLRGPDYEAYAKDRDAGPPDERSTRLKQRAEKISEHILQDFQRRTK